MPGQHADEQEPSQHISRGGRWFLFLWSVGLLVLCVATGWLGSAKLLEYKADTERAREAFWHSPAEDSAARVGAGAGPTDVHVGIVLDRISEIDANAAGWTADFHIWFRWSGGDIRPGEHFQLANGKILERERVVSQAVGAEHFERFRVSARMIKTFDAARVPVGDQSLSIQVEDAVEGADRLRYLANEASADIRYLVAPAGMHIARIVPTVRSHTVPTGPVISATSGSRDVPHSLFVVAMLVEAPVVSRYFRIFQALFASVAICLIVFFIKPIHVDPRFGLPVGAFFAAVGNNISVASQMPESGQVTLVQMVNAISLVTIFLTLVQSAISLYVLDSLGRERFSRVFDRVSFVLLGAGYVVVNVLLPMAAR